MDCPTSEGTLLSAVHGRDRRLLRNIDKRDLQAAKKYGVAKRLKYRNRWMFTYADIVYITESDRKTEVTSYVLPLHVSKAHVTVEDKRAHAAICRKMYRTPAICTSHFIVIVDQSASMKTCDVEGYRTRSDAVFATVALDYIGKQIDNRNQSNAQYTDAVTLIEMHETSTIVFNREPCTNVLFNKFVDRKDVARPSSHGVYKSALDLAREVMELDIDNDTCPIFLMFLSDGKPSDGINKGHYDPADHVYEISQQFQQQLTVLTLGFAKTGFDFSVLQRMAQRAKDGGANGKFTDVNLTGSALSSTVQSISSTMSATRLMCTLAVTTPKMARILRDVTREAKSSRTDDWDIHDYNKWTKYTTGYYRGIWNSGQKQFVWEKRHDCYAICKYSLGQGCERVVYRLTPLDNFDKYELKTNDKLVAKESKYVHNDDENAQFHKVFCKTQALASKLAIKFNDKVRKVCDRSGIKVSAVIKFLSCVVYDEVRGKHNEVSRRTVLVEKRLDKQKFIKWNNNNGQVRGHRSLLNVLNKKIAEPLQSVQRKPAVRFTSLPGIQEISDEEDSGEDEDENVDSGSNPPLKRPRFDDTIAATAVPVIKVEDFPQAFSHYTYRHSKREKLVCDLQGVLDDSVTPVVYELTDPVIHYRSASNRKNVFGRTDHGKKGIHNFLKTHDCNDLCRLLGLPDSHN